MVSFNSLLLASATFFVPIYSSPLDPRQEEVSTLACNPAELSSNKDKSVYKFHINERIAEQASAQGLTQIGVRQKCDSNGGLFGSFATNTENWAYAPLNKFGPENPYEIEVNRCKNDNDRHVWKYNVWLCDPDNWCGENNCGLDRMICPVEKTKAVNLTDTYIWDCSL